KLVTGVQTCALPILAPWTDTVSSTLPSASTTLMVGVAPTCSTMPVRSKVRKPCRDTCSLYGPVGRFGNRYAPVASVTAVRATLRSEERRVGKGLDLW